MKTTKDKINFLNDLLELTRRREDFRENARNEVGMDKVANHIAGQALAVLDLIEAKLNVALQIEKEDEAEGSFSENPNLISVSWYLKGDPPTKPFLLEPGLDVPPWVYRKLNGKSVVRTVEELDPYDYFTGKPDERGIFLVVHLAEFAGCRIVYEPGPGPGLYYKGYEVDGDEESVSVWEKSFHHAMEEILDQRIERAESPEEEERWSKRLDRFWQLFGKEA